jgi:DNA repair ATPase RecN
LITKTESDNKTVTLVKNLSYEQKVDEVTRLVGGSIDNENARNLAKELIENADKYKKAL